jgi:tetratricopeptide (TPR) repeat protein
MLSPRFEFVSDNQVKASATARVEGKGKDAKVLPRVVVHQGMLDRVVKSQEDPEGNADRLALIVSHELSHIVLGHIARRPAGETPFVQLVFTRQQEVDADRKGMELALKAGYSFRRGRSAIERFKQLGLTYSSFEALVANHPSWNDRLAFLDREQAGLWKAMSAFENGTFFLCFEQYASAENCFREVVREFPQCYEAWGNLGNALLMQYCDKLDADDLRSFAVGHLVVGGFYRRPSSLEALVRGVDKTLWNNAVEALQKALTLRPELVLAKANLGLAYLVSPYGQDVEKATQYLHEAADQAASDRTLGPLMQAGVWINAGIADLAAGRIETGARKFDRAEATSRQGAGKLPRTAVSWSVTCALLYNRATLLAASSDPAQRRAATAQYEAYLRTANPASTWWPVAYDRYGKLCQELGLSAKPQNQLAQQSHARFRLLSSVPVGSGLTVTLSAPMHEITAQLGEGQAVPMVRGGGLVRLHYPAQGIDLLCADRVLAISLRGSNAPPLSLHGIGPGGATQNLRLGMTQSELEQVLANEPQEVRQLDRPDVGYAFYPRLGLATLVQDGKVEELVIAQLPRRPAPNQK